MSNLAVHQQPTAQGFRRVSQFISGRVKRLERYDAVNDWVSRFLRATILLGAWLRFAITFQKFEGVVFAEWLLLLAAMTTYNVYVLWQSSRPGAVFAPGWYAILIIIDTALFSLLYILSDRPFSDLYLFYFLPVLIAAEQFDTLKALGFFAYISSAFLISFLIVATIHGADLPLPGTLIRNALPRLVFFLGALFVAAMRTKLLSQSSRELEAVRETALKISANEELQPRLEAVLQATKEILDVDGCKLYLPDRTGRWLVLRAATGLRSSRFEVGSRLPMEQGIAGLVMRTGEPYIEPNYATSPHRIEEIADLFGSVLEVPLKWNGKTIGVLGVFHDSIDRFDVNDRAMLEKFAAHVAVAIHDIELVHDLNANAHGLRGLIEASKTLMQAAPQNQEVLDAVARYGWQLANIYTSTPPQYLLVALVNEAGIIDFAAAEPPEFLTRLRDQVVNINIHAFPRGVVGRTILEGEPQFVVDVDSDPDYIPFNKSSRVQLALPIRGRKRVIGVLSLEHSLEDGLPFDLLYEPLQGLAAQAASAIENVELFEEVQKRRGRAELLREWAARLSSTADLQEVAQVTLEGLRAIISFDRATLQILNGVHRRILASVGVDKTDNPRLIRPLDEDRLASRALGSDDVFVLDNPPSDPDWENLRSTRDVQTWCCAPLRFAGEAIGLITIDHTQPASYPSEIRDLLRLYTSHAASTLHAAVLLEENRHRVVELTTVRDQLQSMIDYMADQRNLAMIGLVYGESIHHANNLLGLAKADATTIEQDPGSQRTSERAHKIKRNIEEYLEIVRKFRRRAVESPKPTAISVHKTIDKVLGTKMLGPIKLATKYNLDNDIAVAPENHIRQVLHVLLSNAIDAMTSGGQLTVTTMDEDVNGAPGIVVTVADTGRGITPEKQATLFEATTVESDDNGRRGTHIGLMWARSFMRSFGGDITYKTGAGGTTMFVHMPRDFRMPEIIEKGRSA